MITFESPQSNLDNLLIIESTRTLPLFNCWLLYKSIFQLILSIKLIKSVMSPLEETIEACHEVISVTY